MPSPRSIAVVIPYYNGDRFIERALRSVFSQTVLADTVVVVNDGSELCHRHELDKVAKLFPIKVVDQKNGGQGSARNAGVAATNSDYICFLDQDDFFLSHHIETLLAAIPEEDERFGFAYADLHHADGDGNIISKTIVKKHATHPKRDISDMLRRDMSVLPSAAIISRQAFDAIGGFDTQFTGYEDDDMFLRMFAAGYTNQFVDEPVTVWCIHSESTSHGIGMVRSRFRFFEKMSVLFPEHVWDCLVPRFTRAFIIDAITAVNRDRAYRRDVLSFVRRYVGAVTTRSDASAMHKLKLRVMLASLEYLPRTVIRGIGSTMQAYFRLSRMLRRWGNYS